MAGIQLCAISDVIPRGFSQFSRASTKYVLPKSFVAEDYSSLASEGCRRPGRCQRFPTVKCINSNNLMVELDENDPNYLTATPLAAVDISSGRDGLTFHLDDGQSFKCRHNRFDSKSLPFMDPVPCILLKLEDKDRSYISIRVSNHPRDLLIDSLHGQAPCRPTVYQVVADMVEVFGFEIKLVRLISMVEGIYCAEIYVAEDKSVGSQVFALDCRASDAINVAVKAKVPIQVHKNLAENEGLKLVLASDFEGELPSEPDAVTEEFNLLRMLMEATSEERYFDAAALRDKLNKYRSTGC